MFALFWLKKKICGLKSLEAAEYKNIENANTITETIRIVRNTCHMIHWPETNIKAYFYVYECSTYMYLSLFSFNPGSFIFIVEMQHAQSSPFQTYFTDMQIHNLK